MLSKGRNSQRAISLLVLQHFLMQMEPQKLRENFPHLNITVADKVLFISSSLSALQQAESLHLNIYEFFRSQHSWKWVFARGSENGSINFQTFPSVTVNRWLLNIFENFFVNITDPISVVLSPESEADIRAPWRLKGWITLQVLKPFTISTAARSGMEKFSCPSRKRVL